MSDHSLLILSLLFLIVGALYSSVGHAGASGYLAAMGLMGIEASVMRPTALAVNVLVAGIALIQFARAGHFSWRLIWPLVITSIPAAFLGGRVQIPADILKLAIGVVLLLSSARMLWTACQPPRDQRPVSPPRLPLAMLVGAALGLISGLTGTGGGIFLSPLMLILNWADVKRTAATSAAFILVNSIGGLLGLASRGWVPGIDIGWLALAAGIGGLIGSYFGSRVLAPRSLRAILAVVLLIAGVKLVTTSLATMWSSRPVASRSARLASCDR